MGNLRVCDDGGALQARGGVASKYEIGKNKTATVTILDDDHRGNFGFEETSLTVEESCGHLEVTVVRKSGARGSVFVPFRTIEAGASTDVDFAENQGELMFENEETEKKVSINIIDQEEYEKNKNFFIELGEPRVSPADKEFYNILENRSGMMTQDQIDVAMKGMPRLDAESVRMEVTLTESLAFKMAVDKMVQKTNLSVLVSTGSWAEQFSEALSVSTGDDGDEEGEGEPGLTLVWRGPLPPSTGSTRVFQVSRSRRAHSPSPSLFSVSRRSSPSWCCFSDGDMVVNLAVRAASKLPRLSSLSSSGSSTSPCLLRKLTAKFNYQLILIFN